MSEDQQKQPEPINSEPQTPPTPTSAERSQTGLEITSETAEPTRSQELPFLKDQSIKVLRRTIDILEGIVERLEAGPEPVQELPATTAPTRTLGAALSSDPTPATPELESAASVVKSADAPIVEPEPSIQRLPVEPSPEPTKPKLMDRLLPSFRSLQAFWDSTLVKVRALLPDAWNQKLSDWALTGAIAGIVVILLVTTAALLPKTPAQVAKAPPNSIEAPPKLVAPEPPKPVEVEPPPTPELTPEQSLIAAIQTQVAEITDHYGNGLIQSIEANFLGSRLIVKVSDGWYDLKESQQNKLADEILHRSGELDFSKLEIIDPEGALLARSPVVGPNMVILKRQELAGNL